MFRDIILECRALIEKSVSRKRRFRKEPLDERPEVSTAEPGLPKHGTEGTLPNKPASTTYTQGAGSHKP